MTSTSVASNPLSTRAQIFSSSKFPSAPEDGTGVSQLEDDMELDDGLPMKWTESLHNEEGAWMEAPPKVRDVWRSPVELTFFGKPVFFFCIGSRLGILDEQQNV